MDQSELFRRHSIRLKDFDYSQAGAYFVTICTKNRQWYFGEIQNGLMQLNATGRLASALWESLPDRFSGLKLGEWVVMPNHIHGILVINSKGEASQDNGSALYDTIRVDASPLRPTGTTPGSVGAIIQNFKSITSRKISAQNEYLKGSVWQRNYYEHIIWNERDYRAISDYIIANPQNWEEDTENLQ